MDLAAGKGRVADLTMALSLASDVGTGQPVEHGLRTCWLSLAVAEALGVGEATRSCVYYVALLRFTGCTSDASETAVLAGGDDVAFNARMAPMLAASSGEGMRFFVRHHGAARRLELAHGPLPPATECGRAQRTDRTRTQQGG